MPKQHRLVYSKTSSVSTGKVALLHDEVALVMGKIARLTRPAQSHNSDAPLLSNEHKWNNREANWVTSFTHSVISPYAVLGSSANPQVVPSRASQRIGVYIFGTGRNTYR